MGFDEQIEALRRAGTPTLVVAPDPGPVRSLALLSGSFDPLTVAHAQLAEWAAAFAQARTACWPTRPRRPRSASRVPSCGW